MGLISTSFTGHVPGMAASEGPVGESLRELQLVARLKDLKARGFGWGLGPGMDRPGQRLRLVNH